MQHFLKRLSVGALILALGVAPGLAADFDPRGLWQTTSGESRYRFDYCGDGTQLCATVVWLNSYATGVAGKALGSYAFDGGEKSGSNSWRGRFHYDGKSTGATVTLSSPKNLNISGCYFIWCKSYDLVKIAD